MSWSFFHAGGLAPLGRLLLALVVPGVLQPSAPAPDLIVSVRDTAGRALAGLSVRVRAGADGLILAHGVTDAHGQTTVTGLTVDHVRVTVSGALPGGMRLVQLGQDAEGIALMLMPPRTRLDLRVDPHGLVLPDPATMIDLVPNGPAIAPADPAPAAVESPTPRSATGLAVPSSLLLAPSTPTGAALLAAPAPPVAPAGLGWELLVVLGLSVVGLLVSLRGRPQ